jgi:hypothetical protein
MRQRSVSVHPLFVLAALSGLLFCMTTLALLMLPWMETTTPFTRWLDRNALPLIASEVACALIAGCSAFVFDRRQSPPTRSCDSGTEPHEPQRPG